MSWDHMFTGPQDYRFIVSWDHKSPFSQDRMFTASQDNRFTVSWNGILTVSWDHTFTVSQDYRFTVSQDHRFVASQDHRLPFHGIIGYTVSWITGYRFIVSQVAVSQDLGLLFHMITCYWFLLCKLNRRLITSSRIL